MRELNTPWRLTASAIYTRPTDARIFGHMDIDVSEVEKLIEAKRAEGIHLTYTHVVAASVARTLAEDAPELNSYIKRGRLYLRDDIGVMLAVDAGDGNLAVMVVRKAHTKSLDEISQEITRRAAEKRENLSDGKQDRKNFLARVPWPFRGLAFRLLRLLIYDFGLKLGALDTNTFGSVLVTNIGKMGLNTGYAALLPASNVPMVLAMGKAEQRAVVRDGEIVIRMVLPITGTFDHRVVDGRQAGKLSQGVVKRLTQPDQLL